MVNFIEKLTYISRKMKILDNEQLDDLQNGYFILQKKDSFKFGTDAVLLSDFAKGCKKNSILDLCTGTAIVPILLLNKTDAKKIVGLEIQEDMCEMARRSVEYNNLGDRLQIICGDLKKCKTYFTPHSFDAVTCNPPYMKVDANVKNELDAKTVARHECLCNIFDVANAAADMLRFHGELYMVHRPSRLADIIFAMRQAHIEPKIIRFVHPTFGKAPVLVLIKGVYHGGQELQILPPMYIYGDDGEYTDELKEIYSVKGN